MTEISKTHFSNFLPALIEDRNSACSCYYRVMRTHSEDYAVARCLPSVTRRYSI